MSLVNGGIKLSARGDVSLKVYHITLMVLRSTF